MPEYLDVIREVAHQGLIDILLMSASINEQLTIKDGLFKNSHITPAARAVTLLENQHVRDSMVTRFGSLRGMLSGPGGCRRVAEISEQLLNSS